MQTGRNVTMNKMVAGTGGRGVSGSSSLLLFAERGCDAPPSPPPPVGMLVMRRRVEGSFAAGVAPAQARRAVSASSISPVRW